MKKILTLRHSTYPRHVEQWHLEDDGKIYVVSYCPSNSPSYTQTIFTPVEALRQYALLTSPVEGWKVYKDHGWHQFIEALEVA